MSSQLLYGHLYLPAVRRWPSSRNRRMSSRGQLVPPRARRCSAGSVLLPSGTRDNSGSQNNLIYSNFTAPSSFTSVLFPTYQEFLWEYFFAVVEFLLRWTFYYKKFFWNGNCVRVGRPINIFSDWPEENNSMVKRALLLPLWVRYFYWGSIWSWRR